ncbi:MAG: hypothetical protein QXS74_09795 [Nitrososphaeria archaeon]
MPSTSNLSLTEIRRLEVSISEYLKDLAVKKGIVKSRNEALVRDILPKTDLGFANEEWKETLTTTAAWNTVASLRLPDKKAMVIYGVRVHSSTPKTTAIKFALGPDAAKVKEIVEIEPALTTEERELIFETPILYEDSQYVNIQFYSTGTGTDRIILLGKVVEPKGEVISE